MCSSDLQQWNAHKGTELKLEIDQVAKKMEQLEEKYPDLLYIPYYRVQLSVAIGDSEDSFADLIPFVKKKQRDFWAWDILGDVCNDNDQKFACYCKGLSCSAPKEMTIGLKQTIIPLLIERQHYDVAKTEVEAILSIRQENGWKVPHQLLDYQSQPWYANAKVTNVKKLYQNYIEQAELLLYADVNEEPIVITHVNNEKAMLSFIYKNTPCYSNYDKRSLKPKIGDIFMARVVNIDPKGYCNYATLRLDNDNTLRSQYVKRIEGEFVIAHSGQFGFIGKDYFVNNETIVKNRLQNHKHYTATAIKNYDSKKQRWGWSVIKILDA